MPFARFGAEIHYIKRLNNYFLAISMPPGNRGILRSVTARPEGPYVNALANDGYFKGGIDSTLFEDDDGRVYFTSGGASSISLMNDDLSAVAGDPHHIEFEKPADGSWTRGSIAMEGATLFKRNGIYYLGGAAFYKGRYSSVVAMSTNIFGPYKNWEEAVPCGGGTDYFEDKHGNWFDAYFGNDNQSPFREKPAIVKIDFGTDGKIVVAKDQPAFCSTKIIQTHENDFTITICFSGVFDLRRGSGFGRYRFHCRPRRGRRRPDLNTRAIQSAVDECAAQGGGTVLVPAGVWLSGSVALKSNICPRLEAGAVLRGSDRLEDYPPNGFRHPENGRHAFALVGHKPEQHHYLWKREPLNSPTALFLTGTNCAPACRRRKIPAWQTGSAANAS